LFEALAVHLNRCDKMMLIVRKCEFVILMFICETVKI
jgi:hypothetical protein